MNAQTAISIISAVLPALPAAVATGAQVVGLIGHAINTFESEFGDTAPTPDEISATIQKIVANTAIIDSL